MLLWGNTMNKEDIIAFFDELASSWDDMQVRNDDIINFILDSGGITKGKKVLDIACGTGVLFPDYLSRGADVVGIDISPEMTKIAEDKYPEIKVLCGDAQTFDFGERFDAIMIYNAFPHFIDPKSLFVNLSKYLNTSGRLTVAHGISEKELAECHSGRAKKVSQTLMSTEKLAEIMSEFVAVDIMISDDKMYMVSGIKQ